MRKYSSMAGLFVLGVPLLGGFVGAPVLQVFMRSVLDLGMTGRLAVEGTLVAGGVFGIWAFPPGGANTGKNWGTYVLCATAISLGVFAFLEGGITTAFITAYGAMKG